MLEEKILIRPLTHRGNFLDNADELIKDGLTGDVALVDRITAADGLESVIWPFLTGVPLQLR
jgi:hypothetical protein